MIAVIAYNEPNQARAAPRKGIIPAREDRLHAPAGQAIGPVRAQDALYRVRGLLHREDMRIGWQKQLLQRSGQAQV